MNLFITFRIALRAVRRNAMRQPLGWDRSAAAYAALYDSVSR